MTDTANLGLPCIEGSQAQKHVTHNDALRILDTLVQLAVLDRDLTAPPASPVEGQSWIVKTGATGAWTGHADAIASWQDGIWQFSVPRIGWLAYVVDESALLAWDGDAWVLAIEAVTPTALNNLTLLGLGTTADTTNPLSAKLNNALFTAKTVGEGGDGHLRYKLSKESAAKTLSFLFQNNFSGRAEIGLTGDDDFHFKVSPDGSTWHDAILIDKTTGQVSFPQGGTSTDIELTLAELSLGIADALNTAKFFGSSGNRFADSFDALAYVDTGAAINLDSGTAGVLKPTIGSNVQISTSGKTLIGNLTGGGGLAAAFDGTTSQGQSAGAATASLGVSTSGYNNAAGVDWGSGVTKTVAAFKVYGPNDNSIIGGATASTLKLQGSNDNSAWTDLTTAIATSASNSQVINQTSGITTTTAYRYHRVNINGNGVNTAAVAEVQFFEAGAVSNVTVASTALTAASAPSSAKLVARVKENVVITLNTDLIFYVSRDGGATYTAFAMTKRFTGPDGIAVYESGDLDISAQPSGASMKWKAVSTNNKNIELRGVYLAWD